VNVNHAGFDDVKKNLLDNECHHQKRGECESCKFWWCRKIIHLIMIVIIKKGEDVNVWIHDFDDAKKESHKVVSKDKHCFKINTRLLQQTKSCFKINSRSSLASKQSVSKTSKALVIDNQKTILKKIALNLNFEPVIDYQMFVIDYQQRNSWNSNSKVMTLQNITT